MPSGSHSGGGGSHFGGGSSGGSHFGGFNSRRSSTQVNLGPRVYVFGGRRYVVSGTRRSGVYACLLGCIIALFAIFAGALLVGGANKSINTIKADQTYYHQMITTAKQNSNYKVKGVITDRLRNKDCDKYYITYAFPIDYIDDEERLIEKYQHDSREDDLEDNWVLGYSFSVYSIDDLSNPNLQISKVIDLAINVYKMNINSLTDSIPFDYLEMPLERDGEYVAAKGKAAAGPVVIVIAVIVLVGCTIGQIALIKTSKQEETQPATVQAETNNSNKPKVNKCTYCGAPLKDGEIKCPNCGGSQI